MLVITLPPQDGVYNFILDVEGYPGQVFALAVTVGLVVLRYKRPDLKRPFKAWTPAVWLRIVTCLTLLAAPFFPPADWKGDVGFFYATYAVVGVGMYEHYIFTFSHNTDISLLQNYLRRLILVYLDGIATSVGRLYTRRRGSCSR
jgi:amino acid transporter